jgi:hypothetical protein
MEISEENWELQLPGWWWWRWYNSSKFLIFIFVLTEQPNDQLQSEQEWTERNSHKVQNKAIYNIWVMMMIKY